MYKIGLIDDDKMETKKIRMTIKEHAPKDYEYEFKNYNLDNTSNLIEKLSDTLIKDIIDNKINGLIVDYKLMIEKNKVKGSKIFEIIKNEIQEFPVIILTNVADDCRILDCIDPDKVYEKRGFFKINEEESKIKVENIFINMTRYKEKRNSIKESINKLKCEINDKGIEAETYDKLIDSETEFSKYCPNLQTELDKVLDTKKLRETVNMLKDIDEVLGRKNEQ